MANLKLTERPEATTVAGTDLSHVVADPAGTPVTKKIKILNLLKRLFTSDGTELAVGAAAAIPDGGYLKRSGTTIIADTPPSGLTTEQVQDIVGAMLADSADLDFAYDDPGASETGTIKGGASALSPAFSTLTDGATVTWATGGARVNNAVVTLGGNRTLDITGEVNGATGVLIVKQDGTGGRTLALPASSKVVDGGAGAITLTAAANGVDVLCWFFDGTNFWWTYGKNFS